LLKYYFLLVLFSIQLSAQDYFIPLNIQHAYEKGTRSMDGTPGPGYWQNSSKYTIKASVEPSTRVVSGEETILYRNNSPDALNQIVIRLYQNFYRYGAQRNFNIHPEAVYEGVTIHQADIGGVNYITENKYNPSEVQITSANAIFNLRSPMMPDSEIELYFKWNFTLPLLSSIRMGTYDSTNFFVAYWFPQVSVYDDIDGWDKFDFNGEQEFYNDFSDFDVEITVPNDYAVWATGVFQNPEEILKDEYYTRYITALQSDSVIKIISLEDIDEIKFNAESQNNTWRFTASGSPDFAFAMSNHYLWDASSVKTGDSRAYVAAVYKSRSKDFYEVVSILRNLLNFFADRLPGVEYPYPSLTIFNGAGGMEFPMIINNSSLSTIGEAAGLAAHEAVHMYFPFYTGTNERKYAFMDEGFAVMLPREIQNEYGANPLGQHSILYENIAGTELDVPPIVPSTQVRGLSYRNSGYYRPAMAYHFLRDYLGHDVFRKAIQKFIKDWAGKHPMPYDLFFSFNESAGEDLAWFWKPWFFKYSYPDLAIKEANLTENEAVITIKRKGSVPVSVRLNIEHQDGTVSVIEKNPGIWKEGIDEVKIKHNIKSKVLKITLNTADYPDVDRSDNIFAP
jgi:hypothetical protein